MGSGSHVAQFFESGDHWSVVLARQLRAAHESGAVYMLIASEGRRKALAEATDVPDDVLVWLDAESLIEEIVVGERVDPAAFARLVERELASHDETQSIWVFDETVDLLWGDGKLEAALHLESMWDQLLARRAATRTCGLSLHSFDDVSHSHAFEQLCDAHTSVMPAESYFEASTDSERLRLVAHLQHRSGTLRTEARRRKRAEEALRKTSEMQMELVASEREANRIKDEFLAMLGHELRNPLSPILTALEIMKSRLGSAAIKERTVIERQVHHLVRLIDDLMDVSRIRRGKLSLRPKRVNLAPVVSEAVEIAGPLFEERGHHLHIWMPDQGLTVYGDAERLAQVIANLLTNAAKYTNPGGTIQIEGGADGEDAVITVRDNGIGIPPELLPRLFDQFVQGGQALDRSTGGLGLGLAIVNHLVALHGGTVTANSEGVGRGTEIVVRLPLTDEEEHEVSSTWKAPTEGKRGHRIMLVDDNLDAVELMAELLAAVGHETIAVADAPSALEQAQSFHPDLAILDIGLPVMNGYELAHHLKALPGFENLRLVAVTGYGQQADRDRSREAGFDEHLVKPVDVQGLEAVIERLMPPS